jgi:hypothetical protein
VASPKQEERLPKGVTAVKGQSIVEESLETMIERLERKQAEEERTAQNLFDELERQMASMPTDVYVDDEFIREDEFTCLGCNMILHRSRLKDPVRRLCKECVS